MTFALGLLALSFLVLVHETGHYIAARLCGVTVETFSIGMGPVAAHKKIGPTDYRLSIIPFGGYCGMKGEKDFQKALDENLKRFPRDPQSFYGVHPLKRLCIALAGPLGNLAFAVLALALVALIGYTYYSADNRIILADEILPGTFSAAREQGLRTGDRILSLGGQPTETFLDISRIVSTSPEEDLPAVIDRRGAILNLTLKPVLDKSSGSGKIGVFNWIDPVLGGIPPGGPAEQAGLQNGDVVLAVDGAEVFSAAQVFVLLENKTQARLTCMRPSAGGEVFTAALEGLDEGGILSFAAPEYRTKRYSPLGALWQGARETQKILALTVKSIGLLFRGVDVTTTVSGPARISYIIGDTVKTGFSAGFHSGLASVLNLLALISASLFLMNLLPVPVLDGGIVVFSLVETLSRRPLGPKFLYRIQAAGIAFIALVFALALFSDAKYFLGVFKQ